MSTTDYTGSPPSTFIINALGLTLPAHAQVQYRIRGNDVPTRQRWAACRCGWESAPTRGGWHYVDTDVRDHLVQAAKEDQ